MATSHPKDIFCNSINDSAAVFPSQNLRRFLRFVSRLNPIEMVPHRNQSIYQSNVFVHITNRYSTFKLWSTIRIYENNINGNENSTYLFNCSIRNTSESAWNWTSDAIPCWFPILSEIRKMKGNIANTHNILLLAERLRHRNQGKKSFYYRNTFACFGAPSNEHRAQACII